MKLLRYLLIGMLFPSIALAANPFKTPDGMDPTWTIGAGGPTVSSLLTTANGAVQKTGGDISSTINTATGSTTARTMASRAADVINIRDYGATQDLKQYSGTLTMALGSTTLTNNSSIFTAAMVGKTVIVPNAGNPGGPLFTTIASYTSATAIVLTSPSLVSGNWTGSLIIAGNPYYGTFTYTAGSTTVTSSANIFVAGMAGAIITVPTAGPGALVAKISSVTSASAAVLNLPDVVAVSAVGTVISIGTDDTAAIQAAITAAESRRISTSGPFTGNLYFPDGVSLTTSSLNMTGIVTSGFRVSGSGTIYSAAQNAPAVDMLGSRYVRWDGVSIRGDTGAMPSIGLQTGRTAGTASNSSDVHDFSNFFMGGSFSNTAFLNEGSETSKFDKILFGNGAQNGHSVTMDGTNSFASSSSFIASTLPVGTGESFNENLFTNCIFSTSGNGAVPLWISSTGRMRVLTSYESTNGPLGAILYSSQGSVNNQLDLDLHFETSSINTIFELAGTSPAFIMEGFRWRDTSPFASTQMMAIDPLSNITSVSMPNIDWDIGSFASGATKLVDTPSLYTASGSIYSPVSGAMNIANFSGLSCIPTTGCTDTSAIPTNIITSALASDGIALSGTVAANPGITITGSGQYYATASPTAAYWPTISFVAPTSGTTATAHVVSMGVIGAGAIGAGGSGYTTGTKNVTDASGNLLYHINVSAVDGNGAITAFTGVSDGTVITGNIPATPYLISGGTGGTMTGAVFKIVSTAIDNTGIGYTSVPIPVFSSTHAAPVATGTATLGGAVAINGNLAVVGAGSYSGNLIVSGNLNAASLNIAGSIAGAIDNVIIGGTTPLAGTFTSITATNANLTTMTAATANLTNIIGPAATLPDLTFSASNTTVPSGKGFNVSSGSPISMLAGSTLSLAAGSTYTSLAAETHLGAENHFSSVTPFVDPDTGVGRAVKIAGTGLAVSGGTKTDTLNVTGATTLTGLVTASGGETVPTLATTDNSTSVINSAFLRSFLISGFGPTFGGVVSSSLSNSGGALLSGQIRYGHTSVVASGTTQATGVAIGSTSPMITLSACAAGAGVLLSTPANGNSIQQTIINNGVAACNIYPNSGSAIGSLAVNAPYILTPNSAIRIYSDSVTQWRFDNEKAQTQLTTDNSDNTATTSWVQQWANAGYNASFGNMSVVGLTATGPSRIAAMVVSNQTTAYTFTAADCGTVVRDNMTTAHNDTVPLGLPLGCTISLLTVGAGLPTIVGATGVTIEAPNSAITSSAQYASMNILIDTAATASVAPGR